MNIQILDLIEGAKKATGCAVIIDVFRAFTVEAYLANNGAQKIYAVGDKDFAYKLKEQNPSYVLIGERHGQILPGFDYGNSPSQISNVDFTGKTIIHTTSAGTQGIANATQADQIITGSLVNAKAIAEYIKQQKFDTVSLVCMGLEGVAPIQEDTLCARYIKDLLLDNDTSYIDQEILTLKQTSGAKFFDKTIQHIFPEQDFYLSVQVDKFNFVLVYDKQNKYIKKINL